MGVDGGVQREVMILKALEEIRDSLAKLVDLAEASGLASSVDRTETREHRAQKAE